MSNILFIGGISCYAAALFFSKTARVDERNAEVLKSVTRVRHLKDLAQLLDAEKSPLLVTISGRVFSETPIIVEEKVEKLNLSKMFAIKQKKKCHNDYCWKLRYETMSSIPKEVPWYLDDGTGRVRVVGALGAIDFELLVENSTFKESDSKLACETLGNHKLDNKPIVFKKIERVLPVGTSLNVVGEASKDDDGTIRIQQSLMMTTLPFYDSSKTIDEHTTKLVDSWRWNKNTSEFLTLFGNCIIATSVIYGLKKGFYSFLKALVCEGLTEAVFHF